jgi:dolichyldiphosphatase
MGYFATFLILHLHFRHKFTPSGYWLDQAFRALVYSALIAWAMAVAYSRYGAFYGLIDLILTFPEVSSILSFGPTDTLGSVAWL